MEIKYGVTGKQRKAMVTAIASIIGADAIYKGVPTCNYEVDYFTIDRSGTLIFDDSADSEEVEHLIEALAERGFVAEQVEPEGEDERCGVVISIPADKVNAEKLEKLLESKKELICRALGVSNLPIEVTDTVVKFPWFSELPDADIIKAYTDFIAALCRMSAEQKRITAKPKDNENEKYAFRCFLLRLRFIGDEYKADRKILLSRLDGSAAFKSGAKKGGEQ